MLWGEELEALVLVLSAGRRASALLGVYIPSNCF